VVIFVLTTAFLVLSESSLSGDDWYSKSVAPSRTLVQSWCEVKGTSTSGTWSECACDGDRNLYLNATASDEPEGRSATVKSSPTQGEEKGPAPSKVTTGEGFTESPSVLVTEHLGCNPTTVAVVGTGMTVAIPRDVLGGLSEGTVLNWEREGGCGRSVGLVSETESRLACLKPA